MAGKTEKKEELLTAGKIAEKLGIPPKKLKQVMEELKIQPDQKRGNCNFYNLQTMEKIKQAVSK